MRLGEAACLEVLWGAEDGRQLQLQQTQVGREGLLGKVPCLLEHLGRRLHAGPAQLLTCSASALRETCELLSMCCTGRCETMRQTLVLLAIPHIQEALSARLGCSGPSCLSGHAPAGGTLAG